MSKLVKEFLATGGIMLIAAITFRESLSLRAGLYDPLGAGTMPRIICAGIVIACAISLAVTLYRHFAKSAKPAGKPAAEGEAPARPLLAAGAFALMVAFAVSINFRVPYMLASSLFLFATMMAIQRFKLSAAPISAALSIAVGAGITFLFTNVFSVDLP